MQIKIQQKIAPFTHVMGTYVMLPQSALCFKIFPTQILVYSLLHHEKELIGEITVPLTGPFSKFTVQTDCESSKIKIFGTSSEGFFSFFLMASEDPLKYSLILDRFPVPMKEVNSTPPLKMKPPKLFLGVNKKQELDGLYKRSDINELFPILYCLGRLLPSIAYTKKEGWTRYLEKKEYKSLFKGAFQGIFCPSLADLSHQGLWSHQEKMTESPLSLLQELAKHIENLYISYANRELTLLPKLPKESVSGRFIHLFFKDIGVDFEFSKRVPRRLILSSHFSGTLLLNCPKEIRSLRLRKDLRSKGVVIKAPFVIECQDDETYYLDNFKK